MNFKYTFCTILFVALSVNIALSQNTIRPLAELTTDKSGGEILNQLVKTTKNTVTVLPVSKDAADEALFQAQITTRSLMGAIIYFSGGLLIDHGWIRLLGSGSTKLPRTLPAWNKGKTFKQAGEKPAYLLIGDDAIGGFFAINGGALGNDPGKVYYLAPDNLNWESTGKGYSDFVDFCLNGNLDLFYKGFRWKDWQKNAANLNGDKVFSFYPYLWSKEGKDISKTARTVVPVQEHYDATMATIKQLKQ